MKTKKAISEVLAMLLMVVIVVGLIGLVYFFISGMVGRQTSGVIDTSGSKPNCIPGSRIEILATNAGTTTIDANQIRVFVLGKTAVRSITAEDKTTALTNIDPGVSFWILITDLDAGTTGTQAPQAGRTYRGQIVYAGKAVDFVVTC